MRVKRQAVHDAILLAAEQEFAENGYVKATISKIARRAGTAPSNVYVYFQSKLEIVLAVYEPWFKRQILDLEQAVADKTTVEQKLTSLLEGLWKYIPHDTRGLTTTLVQALATATPQDKYNPELLRWTEHKIAQVLSDTFRSESASSVDFLALAHMIMFTFDGVGLRHNLRQSINREAQMITEMVALLSRLDGEGEKHPDRRDELEHQLTE